jgi:hypothetical protein
VRHGWEARLARTRPIKGGLALGNSPSSPPPPSVTRRAEGEAGAAPEGAAPAAAVRGSHRQRQKASPSSPSTPTRPRTTPSPPHSERRRLSFPSSSSSNSVVLSSGLAWRHRSDAFAISVVRPSSRELCRLSLCRATPRASAGRPAGVRSGPAHAQTAARTHACLWQARGRAR